VLPLELLPDVPVVPVDEPVAPGAEPDVVPGVDEVPGVDVELGVEVEPGVDVEPGVVDVPPVAEVPGRLVSVGDADGVLVLLPVPLVRSLV
jgi:hypothetical protein